MIKEGKYADVVKQMIAERTCKTGRRFGQGSYGSYQTLGDLNLEFAPLPTPVSDYKRWLDIDEAVAGVSYKAGEDVWTREIFSSAVFQAIVVRVACSRKACRELHRASFADQVR